MLQFKLHLHLQFRYQIDCHPNLNVTTQNNRKYNSENRCSTWFDQFTVTFSMPCACILCIAMLDHSSTQCWNDLSARKTKQTNKVEERSLKLSFECCLLPWPIHMFSFLYKPIYAFEVWPSFGRLFEFIFESYCCV